MSPVPADPFPMGRDGEPTEESELLWAWMGTIWSRRRLVALVTVGAAVLSLAIALLLPREYAGEARVLQPESSPLLGLAPMSGGSLGGGLSAILGRGTTEYNRYLAILHSRSLRLQLVEQFNLLQVYNVESKRHPVERALVELDKALEFEVDAEYGFLTVRAFDRDPDRAAAIANFAVALLNDYNARLASENARQSRQFIETRLIRARTDLDSVRAALQSYQERHGVVELPAQAEAFLRASAEQRGRAAELEVHYRTLLQQYGPENPHVQAARGALSAAQAQERRALGGGEALLPISIRHLPAAAREYAELMQEQLIQATIIETILPLYEQAVFQERLEAAAVQVLDPAVVPVLPARPSRRLIVAVAVFSALMLVSAFVLIEGWLRRNRYVLAARFTAMGQSA